MVEFVDQQQHSGNIHCSVTDIWNDEDTGKQQCALILVWMDVNLVKDQEVNENFSGVVVDSNVT